jgi:hypothetical protein
MNIDEINGWNTCIRTLYDNKILSSADLVKVWEATE